MPRTLAKRLSVVAPSATLAMGARAQEMRSRGIDVFNFTVGEPDFEPPRHVLDAAKTAIDAGVSKYTAVSGVAPLKQAIAAAVLKTRGVTVTPDQICVSVGAKHVLYNLATALFEEGDEVVILAPYWVSYPEQVRMMGATPVIVQSTEEEGFRISPAALKNALSPRTKAVIFNSPNNPSGMAYSKEELLALLHVLKDTDAFIISDEIYGALSFDGRGLVSAYGLVPELLDRTILVDGVSKSYAMTGWRIGWMVAPKNVVKACDMVQGQSTSNPTAVAQQAALAALTGPQEEIAVMRAKFEERRSRMVNGLNSVPGIRCRLPEGAFYAFANVTGLYGKTWGTTELTDEGLVANFLLDQAHVVSVPGGAFGAPGYLRFSYATADDRIDGGIEAMKRAIAQLK